jgi:hypothetical protein
MPLCVRGSTVTGKKGLPDPAFCFSSDCPFIDKTLAEKRERELKSKLVIFSSFVPPGVLDLNTQGFCISIEFTPRCQKLQGMSVHHTYVKYGVRSPKLIWAPSAQLYSLAETPQHPPLPHLGSDTRALLVSQDRRHLCETPWKSYFNSQQLIVQIITSHNRCPSV